MKLILVDVSNLAHRYWYTIKTDNGVIYGFLRGLRDLQAVTGADRFAFFFDSGTHKRRELYPEYKANRTAEGKEGLYQQIDDLRLRVLPGIGFRNLFHQKGYEADDLIASMCDEKSFDDYYTIISTDTDLWQLLYRDKVTIWNQASKSTMSGTILKQRYGLTPSQWVWVKALKGDSTDNLKGVEGVGEVNAVRAVRGVKSPSVRIMNAIAAAEAQTLMNVKLIELPYPGTKRLKYQNDFLNEDEWHKYTNPYGVIVSPNFPLPIY